MIHFSINNLQIRSSYSSTVQLHSIDYYHRLQKEQLTQLRWEHLCSVIESKNAGITIRGYTDWQAIMDGSLLSLSWDWLHHFEYEIQSDFGAGLRTNIHCVDDRGYDLSLSNSEALLSEVIERLNWHQFVVSLH